MLRSPPDPERGEGGASDHAASSRITSFPSHTIEGELTTRHRSLDAGGHELADAARRVAEDAIAVEHHRARWEPDGGAL